jgi:hypothetical protein
MESRKPEMGAPQGKAQLNQGVGQPGRDARHRRPQHRLLDEPALQRLHFRTGLACHNDTPSLILGTGRESIKSRRRPRPMAGADRGHAASLLLNSKAPVTRVRSISRTDHIAASRSTSCGSRRRFVCHGLIGGDVDAADDACSM